MNGLALGGVRCANAHGRVDVRSGSAQAGSNAASDADGHEKRAQGLCEHLRAQS